MPGDAGIGVVLGAPGAVVGGIELPEPIPVVALPPTVPPGEVPSVLVSLGDVPSVPVVVLGSGLVVLPIGAVVVPMVPPVVFGSVPVVVPGVPAPGVTVVLPAPRLVPPPPVGQLSPFPEQPITFPSVPL